MNFVLQLNNVEKAKNNEASNRDDHDTSRVIQCLENDVAEVVATHTLPLKSVSVTYPVAKAREIQRIQHLNTGSQVLATRVISQKLPSGYQGQSLALNAAANALTVRARNTQKIDERGVIAQGKGQRLQEGKTSPSKLQVGGTKTITGANSMPNIQRIHVKQQNITGQSSSNLQKVKSVTNVNQGIGQRNSLARIQTVAKSQTIASPTGNQFTNQNLGQRNQSTVVQKTGQINAGQKSHAQVYSNQKGHLLHTNHKAQQQYTANHRQAQGTKVVQKTLTIPRPSLGNNVGKLGNSVTGLQKGQQKQSRGQLPCKTQGTSPNSSRVQIANVCKTNNNPNMMITNPSVISVAKQIGPGQSQPQLQIQTSPQANQKANLTIPTQRSPSITTVQKVPIGVTNNRPQLLNSKTQQMVMRVGVPKNSSPPQTTKASPTKITKPISPANSIQALNRPSNSQPVKIIQQQQNVGPQNAQKQPGCIKTIPAQKSVPRNPQKVGIKTSLNTNVGALKSPGATSQSQKSSIKTLMPQQNVGQNMVIQKNQPIKIQQQTIQQKQLVMTSQFPQQTRQQVGQIKTLMPVAGGTEIRKDVENNEPETKEEERPQSPTKSPIRRMPLPYECLQFVLQDHNYGAPPPRTPPPPSPPPHPKQQPINGASSSTTAVQHPYIYGPVVSNASVEDDAASAISSEPGREAEPEGEETETAPEGEGDDEDSVTRCICDFEHDDGYMICCDRCLVWQHVDCMGIDRSNIPDEYLCEICRPRRVDRQRARALQMRKREELLNSDTSSETSSTSSADTDVGVNAIPKKRPLPQAQQQQQQSQVVPRRKSDPPPQVRRLNNNNNNNNNVAKRQRRDSHPRQSSAVRKKEAVVKRGPGKRKTKRRMSVDDKEDETQDAWTSNVAPLRQWIERYEEAVTNHYSPELRARISSIKVNGTHGDLRQSNMSVIATGKCRLNVHSNNLRFLVATMYLPSNTPVVELRGKYMLSTQHRPAHHPQGGRQHSQRPGPFVFFYRLPRDGTEVCVDTRTYGNDARFVRRSCKPNAEVKHCIEKGTLHLYIVTTTTIEKNAEITIKHDQHELLLSPNPNCPISPIICACNNPRECQITTNPLTRRGSNGSLSENADGRERRRRGRRNTISEDDTTTPIPTTSINQSLIPVVTIAPVPVITTVTVTPVPAPSPKRPIQPSVIVPKQPIKEESITITVPEATPSIPPQPTETKKDKKKMTREERKMEAIMKAFERLEKAEQRKQEVQARNAQRKESGSTHSDNEDAPLPKQQKQQNSDRPLRRKRRKGRARTTSTSNNRRTRLNSADSDVSSGDESNSMQSPPLQTRENYTTHLRTPGKIVGETSNGTTGIPTAAGLLLALANSNVPTPSSPPLQQPTPIKSPTCDSGASSSSQSSTPSTPLSSACLLVAAAVGPLAPGFKFPKTKKVLMNEWLKESPDPPVTLPQVSLTNLPSNSLQNSINPLRNSDFPLPNDPSEFLSQSYAAKSLATLVQAANSVSGICDSPPQRKVTGNQGCTVSSGSAKKRWLRQAISEECDSPNSRPESPPTEMVAPPKKRRIARESLSSDNYTPPTTPTMLVPEILPNRTCQNDDEFEQSPVEQQDERTFDTDIKESNVDSEALDSDETSFQKKSPILSDVKSEVEACKTEEIKAEDVKEEVKPEVKSEDEETQDSKPFLKTEDYKSEDEDVDMEEEIKPEVKEEVIERGTVEIIDQDDQDTEMDDANSPQETMESDAILKERVAEMRLEFGGNIVEEITTEVNIKHEKCEDIKSDDNMSIDEFDVEAQMKKITGDDGNDYKEKIDSSSEKDKSMDGIEGLMESSKEDSESDDKEDDFQEDYKIFDDQEDPTFKEFDNKKDTEDPKVTEESQKVEETFVTSSVESVFESTSSNMDTESIDPPKIFQSIPPLSERIRKKTDIPVKSQLTFEAAIIESTIIETKNGEEKSMLSTALRELLEAKLDEETTEVQENIETSNSTSPIESKLPSTESSLDTIDIKEIPLQETHSESTSPKDDDSPSKEVKRLKDPRTVIPNSMPAPAFKPDTNPPVKRKLSISEYRKRKQQSSGTPPEPEQSNDPSVDKNSARGRSDSASSGTSSLSSDEEGSKMSLNLDIPSLTTLPLFAGTETEEKKGGEEGAIGWSAAPTLVERQRENLTERLKREFGLFLSDDEEERARKQGLTAEAILKARKTSPPQVSVGSTPPGYPIPQLPPQPYIPPPGSAIHYPPFPIKPCQQFQFPVPTNPPIFTPPTLPTKTSQFLIPEAPPGSNPYPPQFIPVITATVPKFTPVTSPPINQCATPQKPFFTHPAPRS